MKKLLNKIADNKFKHLGFTKVEETTFGTYYERYNEKYKFTQTVSILHKHSGRHLVHSYDKELIDTKGMGNTCVGMSYKELKACALKMKAMGLS